MYADLGVKLFCSNTYHTLVPAKSHNPVSSKLASCNPLSRLKCSWVDMMWMSIAFVGSGSSLGALSWLITAITLSLSSWLENPMPRKQSPIKSHYSALHYTQHGTTRYGTGAMPCRVLTFTLQ